MLPLLFCCNMRNKTVNKFKEKKKKKKLFSSLDIHVCVQENGIANDENRHV
jgi:hypothetical protein